MTDDCYIIANGLPPALGWQPRPAGIRADQLAAQARRAFKNVKTILFFELMNRLREDRGPAILAGAHPDIVVIALDDFGVFADRIAPATLVFGSADFADQAEYAAERHHVLYDIATPPLAALAANGVPAEELSKAQDRHVRMLNVASRAFVGLGEEAAFVGEGGNGAIAKRDGVVINPVAPPIRTVLSDSNDNGQTQKALLVSLPPDRLFDTGPMLRAVAGELERHTGPIVLLGPPAEPHAPQTLEHSQLLVDERVYALTNPSVVNRAEVFHASYGLVEWVPATPATRNTISTTALEAIAAGVPVLHQRGTPLDDCFAQFPGVLADAPIETETLRTFCATARNGGYRDAVAGAQEQLASWRDGNAVFSGFA